MRRRNFLATMGAASAATVVGAPGPAAARTDANGVVRTELWARGEHGLWIHVREVRNADRDARPLLLVHGARPDGVAAFDLPVLGGSLAADLARVGYAVYVMDLRGFGRSGYPPEMSQDPETNPPLVRSDAAMSDIDTAVALVRRRCGGRPTAFGWATGGHWVGMYAALHPDRISDAILLNTLYSGTSPWPLQSEMEDPDRPGHPRPQPAWRAVTADALTSRWDAGLEGDDADARRDPAVRDAYRTAALRVDPTSADRTPPSFRNPTGPLIDAFYLAQGRQLYDASLIRARTLVLRAENDFWSRPEDSERLAEHLTSARSVRVRTLPGASHFLHLERIRYGRGQLLDEIRSFLPV
ncbi:alpha/beta fold hydrolase [Streptomyces ureilyticus]|uniref:Alpha/beta hydrolase n=1 Tax=Streptomyces ureilyticus TaxID=1775131 RepID=A0ABX0E0X6_9ACTN|nr:alpha/beta fold hydrolase [Streptomyces ureilyticus]NGO46874.1 alpha/beta hydrolase [Streptomyces ureilyticus]